jgi:hypothetical protein
MQKNIIGFICALCILGVIPQANAGFFDSISNAIGSVSDFVSDIGGVVNDAGGVVNQVNNISNQVHNITDTVNQIQWTWDDISNFDDLYDNIQEGGGRLPSGSFTLPAASEFATHQGDIADNPTSARGFILNILNFFLSFLGLVGVAVVIYGGYLYVTAQGEDGQIEKSKKILIYAVIGILVVLSAFALVNTVITQAPIGGDDRENAVNGNSLSNNQSINNQTQTFLGGSYQVKTPYQPGQVLPAGTTLPNGTTLSIDTIVGNDGSVTVGAGLNNNSALGGDSNSILDFQDGLMIEGEGVENIGSTALVPLDSAKKGIEISLTVQANALIDFGDNTPPVPLNTIVDPQAKLTHRFGEERNYTIRAVAVLGDGRQKTFQKTITVGGVKSNIRASKTQGFVGEEIILDGGSSSTSVGSILNYQWSCTGATGCFPNAEGKAIAVAFGGAGNYEITLKVENNVGGIGETTQSIQIIDTQPRADFRFQSTNQSQKPAEFQFNASQSTNIQGQNIGLTYVWNFDGTEKITTTPSTNFDFETTGTFSASLTVKQNINGQELVSEPLTQEVSVDFALPADFQIIP